MESGNEDSNNAEGFVSGISEKNLGENEDSDNEPFYFESDSLALRHNSDYSAVLRTLVLLEGQRVKASEDIETLIDLKEAALQDPNKFISLLNHRRIDNDDFLSKIPSRQKIYLVPEIDWDKYYECVDLADLESIKNQNLQRVQSLRQATKMSQEISSNNEPTRSSSRNKQTSKTQQQEKPSGQNYNKSWSVEEQRKLEELLIEFPPEDNEAARFRKIANKLGTRTPLQVQSHCQKYFIKLAKAGLPIPGRMPNLKTYVTKKGNRGNRRSSCVSGGRGRGAGVLTGRDISGKKMVGRGVSLNEISSMWTSFNPPITMNDEFGEDESQIDQEDWNEEDDEEEGLEENEDDEEDDENSQGLTMMMMMNSENSQMSNSSSTNLSLPTTSSKSRRN